VLCHTHRPSLSIYNLVLGRQKATDCIVRFCRNYEKSKFQEQQALVKSEVALSRELPVRHQWTTHETNKLIKRVRIAYEKLQGNGFTGITIRKVPGIKKEASSLGGDTEDTESESRLVTPIKEG